MNFYFIRGSLFISSREINLPLNINGLIKIDDLIIVFVYGDTAEEMEKLPTNNVYAFNGKGEQVWQIQEAPQIDEQIVSYADVNLNDSGEVVAGTTIGAEYQVNLRDGSIKPYGSGRPW